jgi:hypothetical protein
MQQLTDYPLTDAERSALLAAALHYLAHQYQTRPAAASLLSAVAKIQGVDTVLIAQRAYPPP